MFSAPDPDEQERERRRELLGKAASGDGKALAELRALGLTRWERGAQVLIRNGELVGAKRPDGQGDEDPAGQ